MNKAQKIGTIMLVVTIALLPLIASAALVECGTGDQMCTLKDFLNLLYNVVKFIVFNLAIPFATLAIVVAGARLALSKGNGEHYTAAIKGLNNILWGFGVLIVCGLVVLTFLKLLQVKEEFILPNIRSGQVTR